jgi:hypothetical protein
MWLSHEAEFVQSKGTVPLELLIIISVILIILADPDPGGKSYAD